MAKLLCSKLETIEKLPGSVCYDFSSQLSEINGHLTYTWEFRRRPVTSDVLGSGRSIHR